MVAHGDVAAMEAPIINGNVVDGDASGGVADTDPDGDTLTVANPGVFVGSFGTLTLNGALYLGRSSRHGNGHGGAGDCESSHRLFGRSG